MSQPTPVFIERVFHLDGAPHDEPTVVFRMWCPYQPENDYPHCRFALITKTDTVETRVDGVDGVDCIINGLAAVGSKLAGWNQALFGGQLRWEGSPDLGLPTIEDSWPHNKLYQEALEWSLTQQAGEPEG